MNAKAIFIFCCVALFTSCTSKGENNSNPSTSKPVINIKDARVTRTNTATKIRFYVDLSASSKQEISVRYSTESGTAKVDSDFKATSSTLNSQQGQQKLHIDIPIIVDSLHQPSQKFYVQLSNAKNAKITKAKTTGTIVNDGTYLPTDNSGFISSESYPGYKLVWSDEFNEQKLNKHEWNYETGTGSSGWGNNELENYTSRPKNIFLSSGNLVVAAHKEDYGGNHYTSARITTQNKKTFTYGRVDIRAKLPVGHGLWPALWMLGNNISSVGWPKCGEIDIMELVGKNPRQIVGSFHWQKADGSEGTFTNTYTLSSGDFKVLLKSAFI